MSARETPLAATARGVLPIDFSPKETSEPAPNLIPAEVGRPLPGALSLGRPVPPFCQPYVDQTYLYGTTGGGAFRPHAGVEFNVPAGAPTVACARGTVARVTGPEDGNRVSIDHDPVEGWIPTTVFAHSDSVTVKEGESIESGAPFALAGSVGRATNTHVHFEVRWRREGEPLAAARLSNPELWLAPARPDFGAVAIRGAAPGTGLRGLAKPFPAETAFDLAERPDPSLDNDAPGSGWIVLSDLPEGRWEALWCPPGDRTPQRIAFDVVAGQLRVFDAPNGDESPG